MSLLLCLSSVASFSSRTPAASFPISTNSFTWARPTCRHRGLKRRTIEMSRGYQPEEHCDPRVSFEGREPNAGDPTKSNDVRERVSDDGWHEPTREPESSATRVVHEIRGRTYRLRSSEIATMVELGKFRAVAREDLAEFAYRGKSDRMNPDLENLVRQELVAIKSVPHQELGSRQLLTLTKHGYRFLTQTQSAEKGQSLYYGFANSREAHHDADLYRLYQKAAAKL